MVAILHLLTFSHVAQIGEMIVQRIAVDMVNLVTSGFVAQPALGNNAGDRNSLNFAFATDKSEAIAFFGVMIVDDDFILFL